jgi:hypothetical protein
VSGIAVDASLPQARRADARNLRHSFWSTAALWPACAGLGPGLLPQDAWVLLQEHPDDSEGGDAAGDGQDSQQPDQLQAAALKRQHNGGACSRGGTRPKRGRV